MTLEMILAWKIAWRRLSVGGINLQPFCLKLRASRFTKSADIYA
jgi:hypothetical protein